MNIEEINNINLVDLLSELGFTPVRVRDNLVYYHSPFYDETEASFIVDVNTNTWQDKGIRKSGNVVQFGQLHKKAYSIAKLLYDFEQYDNLLIGGRLIVKPIRKHKADLMTNIETKPLESRSLLSFLRTRGIITDFAKKYGLELSYYFDKKRYIAIAFRNAAGGYEIHNQYFRGCIGNQDITIVHFQTIGVQKTCCIFENYLDFLSYKTLGSRGCVDLSNQQPCDYIILNHPDNLMKCLSRLRFYNKIYCYMHNNKEGHVITDTISGIYSSKVIDCSTTYSDYISLNRFIRQY